MIRESESVDAPSDFPVSQEEMDLFLRVGSNTEHARMKLLAECAANSPEITEFVKRTFHHGYGLITPQGPVSAWAVEDGIRFARGNAARYAPNTQTLPWNEVASRIARLLDEGRFVTNVEIVENPGFERREIAESLLHLFGDLTEEAQNKGYLSRLHEVEGGGFPDELERLAAALEKPEIRDPVTEEFRQFVTAWRANHDLLRFWFHKPDEILRRLDRLKTPRREFHSDMAELPETRPFITEDEISQTVSSVSTERKIRVRDFWRTHTSSKERANFLRDMYGTGGYSSGVSNAFNSWMFYESKGMTLKKGACADVQLSWNAVASRVDALMAAGRYLSDEELERYQRKRQEREQSRAAQTPDTEKPDTEKPSDRREPIPETPESETVTPGEDVSATVQELTATENITPETESDSNAAPETSNVAELSPAVDAPGNAESVTPEIHDIAETRTDTESAPVADAPGDTEPPAPKIDSLSPILHYLDLILPWENVEGFFRDHPSEQERIDYMRRRFAFRPRGHADVAMNGREGIRVEFEAVPDRLEIWTEDSAAPEFGAVLSWREVCRAVADELGLELTREEIFQAYAAVKVDHPNDLVLYQTGDFFEIFGEDAERAAPLLGINLGEKPAFQGESAVAFCGVPANALDLYLPKLREQYDVTVCGVTGQKRERTIVSFLSFAHEAQQASRVPEPVRAGNAPTVSREPIRDATFREPTRDGNDSQTPQKPEQTLPPEPPRQPEQRPPREVTQEDADEALRRWNGNMDSKRAVVRHMNAHARERETAAWLSREFSGQETPSFRAELPDEGLTVEIPWPKVQRRIAQLIKQDKFFTAEELDNFENIDPVEIKEALAERAEAREETTTPDPAVITPDPEDVSVPGADRNGEKFDPFAPPYHVGDTVWLENAAFQISAIQTYDVELLDPTLRYPVHRAENRALFEIMLYQDPRNGSITEYLPANLKNTNGDLLNILTENGGLLYEQDRARIAGWIRAGESNAQIAQRLPGMLTGRSDTVTLLRGDRTDYRAAEKGLEIRAPDSADKLTFYWFDWPEIASVLRAKFQQEREGFYRDPAIKEAVNLPGTLRYQVGDSVVVPYPDRYIIGTVGYITNLEVRIDTGANSWESELINRIRFEEAVRHDERNAHLFQPEEATRETETSEPDGTEADTPEIVSAEPTDAETPLTAPEPETGVPEAVSAPVAGTNAPAPEFSQAGNEDTPEDFCPYKVGDTVYLDDTAFLITEIRRHSVQLQDPALSYPVSRAESREYFERLLRRDIRNAFITDFLAASLDTASGDLIEALTGDGGLLESRDKKRVSSWFRAGESNPRVAQRLSDFYAGTAETMTLSGGERADYFASNVSLQILITDGRATSLSFPWNGIAPLLRAMYQQERNGFQRDAPSPQPAYATEAKPSPKPEMAPETEAAPRAEIVEGTEEGTEAAPTLEAVREPEPVSAPETAEETEPAAQAEIVTETQTAPEPAKKNFRITDERLGEGGPKAKYRMNVEAIRTLKEIERDGRSASEAEQEILSRYVGWGGIPDAFDPDKEAWSAEYRELKELLTDDEYRSARASTLNAHYTSPVVIKAVYEALGNMGFKTGNILEPSCGIGNFFGLLPESMGGSKLYGVELDSVTGRIAGQLYPEARITVRGYEKTNFPRDFFDIAIGNVPFGNYQVSDPAYNKLGFTIHNYFFAKALDHVRPGGVIAFLTSRYTLDSQNSEVREYLAKRARLLGAIRLPNDAFKANAGTEVVSDIIFLQKSDAPIIEKPEWIQTGENSDGFAVNRYFLQNPDMVLGLPTSESTQYGRQDYTVEPLAGVSLAELLHQAVANIRGEIKEAELPDLGEDEPVQDYIPADPNVRNFSYAIVNGEVYYRENSLMVRPDLSEAAKERVRGMVELRDCVHRLIALQMDGSEALSIYMEQQKLNKLYDAYTAKYGLINNRNNASAFSADSAYYLLCSLEILDNEGRLERKADMFTKRTIKPHAAVTRVDTASEALAVSIAEKAKVDIGYMSQLSGKSEEELTADLKGVIFLNPMSLYSNRQEKYLAADEYLSGNVRQKLQEAEQTAVTHPEIDFSGNIEALRQAQPKDLDASEIDVRLGATWVDKRYIQQFMYELLKTPWDTRRDIRVNYSAFTSEWSITHKSHVSKWDVAARTTYGTSRINAYHILEDTLNLRDVRIYDTDKDPDTGKERRVLNQKETTLAQQKQQAIKDAFRDWVWKDPRRRQDLAQTYNRLFNAIRPREYNGQHITFSGINPEITLREHQLNAIAHVLYGGNTLLAHEVGAGKTFEMVAAAMESKRLGLCQKSLFAVPNHLTEQWAAEFLRLYPSANILVATKRDFETRNRKKFCARIATGDYDAIIIGHSQFEKIPVSYERRERLLQEQIMEIEEGIEELELSGAEEFSVKQMERTKRSLEARLEKLQSTERKDDVVTFEQLGVDRLFVDEAHSYKNCARRCA